MELKKLEKWLKVPGNSKMKLARLLGYRSSSTVHNWLARKSIPVWMHHNLEEIFNENK